MDVLEIKMKLIKKLVDKIELPLICGFLVLPDDDEVQVIVKINLMMIKKNNINPYKAAESLRTHVKNKLRDYLGFDVKVGSIGLQKCD